MVSLNTHNFGAEALLGTNSPFFGHSKRKTAKIISKILAFLTRMWYP
jgi:hypothetical protein